MNSKVSIIIPSYNHSKYITQTIASVTEQTHSNLEIIIIDDGSSDNSCDLIREISNPRIVFIEQENQGAHAAINRGLKIASGDYIAILNSDDLFPVNRIERCLKNVEQVGENSLITSYIEVVDSDGKFLGIKESFKNMFPHEVTNPNETFLASNDSVKNLLMFNYVATTSNIFIHKSIVEKIGYFYGLRYVHDWDYLLRIIQDYPVHIISEPLLKYRVHSSNTIKENQARMILEICWVLARNYPNILPKIVAETNSSQKRLELYNQMYNSIQVYGCEKIILNLLLMFAACKNDPNISDLDDILNPHHELNQQFIQKIENLLAVSNKKNIQATKNVTVSLNIRIKNILSRFQSVGLNQ